MKDGDLIIAYIVTYDLSDGDDRDELNKEIETYEHCKLSETTYLVLGNKNLPQKLYAIPKSYKVEDDKFVIIDITNNKYIYSEKYEDKCVSRCLAYSGRNFLLG